MSSQSNKLFMNDHGRIVEVLSNDGRTVTYCRQGGGYVAKLSALEFADIFRPYDPPSLLSACYVGIDGWDESFVAYGDYRRWNGWFCPRFTESQADAVMAFNNRLNETLTGDACTLAKHGDAYVLSSPGNEYVEVKPVITDTEDGPLPLYDFSFGWCWESRGKKRVVDAVTQPRALTLAAGIATLPNGRTIDLLAIQRTLTNQFVEHGTGDLADAAEEMMKLTGYRIDAYGEAIPYDPEED